MLRSLTPPDIALHAVDEDRLLQRDLSNLPLNVHVKVDNFSASISPTTHFRYPAGNSFLAAAEGSYPIPLQSPLALRRVRQRAAYKSLRPIFQILEHPDLRAKGRALRLVVRAGCRRIAPESAMPGYCGLLRRSTA